MSIFEFFISILIENFSIKNNRYKVGQIIESLINNQNLSYYRANDLRIDTIWIMFVKK